MDILHAIFLAIIQGITEFLPVSSSAHLIVLPRLFGWPDQGIVFDIAVHVGTLLAVVLYFKKDVFLIARGKVDILKGQRDTAAARLVFQLLIATIPVLIVGFLLRDWQAYAARDVAIIAGASILFGVLLLAADIRKPRYETSQGIDFKDAFIFGLFQILALIPGTSRSGACVTAGRMLGYPRETAGRFGSLMAMPVIAIAGGYSLFKTVKAGEGVSWQTDMLPLSIGVGVSFICALAGIHILMTLLTRIGYWPFVLYRIALGVGLMFWLAL